MGNGAVVHISYSNDLEWLTLQYYRKQYVI